MDKETSTLNLGNTVGTDSSLLVFPCAFPIKVMGRNVDHLSSSLCAIALQFDPNFDENTVEIRSSKAGNYLGITLTIEATSQVQLDNLYRALSSHPLVKVVL
jgi:putative lipoic acid-binding regulatory protein